MAEASELRSGSYDCDVISVADTSCCSGSYDDCAESSGATPNAKRCPGSTDACAPVCVCVCVCVCVAARPGVAWRGSWMSPLCIASGSYDMLDAKDAWCAGAVRHVTLGLRVEG